MRVTIVLLVLLAFAAVCPAQPRHHRQYRAGRRARDSSLQLFALLRTTHIVSIRGTPSSDRVGVQTESGPSAGCHDPVLERSGGAWHVAGKKGCLDACRPVARKTRKSGGRALARSSELSEADFSQIKEAPVSTLTTTSARSKWLVAVLGQSRCIPHLRT